MTDGPTIVVEASTEVRPSPKAELVALSVEDSGPERVMVNVDVEPGSSISLLEASPVCETTTEVENERSSVVLDALDQDELSERNEDISLVRVKVEDMAVTVEVKVDVVSERIVLLASALFSVESQVDPVCEAVETWEILPVIETRVTEEVLTCDTGIVSDDSVKPLGFEVSPIVGSTSWLVPTAG